MTNSMLGWKSGAIRNQRSKGISLKLLHKTRRSLPDRAQYRPAQDVYAESDFYYERKGLPGVCIFCDGSDHDLPERKASDDQQRGKLRDLGYRVIEIRYDNDLEGQIGSHADVFGAGVKKALASLRVRDASLLNLELAVPKTGVIGGYATRHAGAANKVLTPTILERFLAGMRQCGYSPVPTPFPPAHA